MKKEKFTATYGGNCYKKAYGRKIFKRGLLLHDIKDDNNTLISETQILDITKAFEKIALAEHKGKRVEFLATCRDDRVYYISDVQFIEI